MHGACLGGGLGMLGTTVTLYNTLDELGIDYTEVTHPAVTTMEPHNSSERSSTAPRSRIYSSPIEKETTISC